MHGQEVAVGALFDDAGSVAVDEDGALFGLLFGVSADIYKSFDDVVEGVHVVVVEEEAATAVFEHGGFFGGLWANVGFLFHA